MADALCGPSSPLQSLQKHTQADHTLLQDRFSGPRHSLAQGFRTRDPRAGTLDAEFAAFEAGPGNPFHLEQPLLRGNLPSHQTLITQRNGAASGWAADFQNLHISNQPIPSHHFRAEAPLLRSNGWQNDFSAHQSNSRSVNAQGKQAVRSPSQNQYTEPNWRSGQYNFNDGYMSMAPMPYSYGQEQSMPQQQQSQQQEKPMYDEAGFADAFEEASQHAQDMVIERDAKRLMVEQDGSDLLHKDAIPMDHSSLEHGFASLFNAPSPTQLRIGSDAIPYQEQKARTPDQDNRDADELARTAGQLLTSVQHDTSDKFQNSQFLALMRKIRDGEVRVESEEFKETYGSDTMVSNLSASVMHRAEVETKLLLSPLLHIGFSRGSHIVYPTHILEGERIDLGLPEHCEYLINGIEKFMKRIETGTGNVIFHPPSPFSLSDDAKRPSIFDEDEEFWLTSPNKQKPGLEDPSFTPFGARTQAQTDAHQLHPGGRYYPEQSPPLHRATMSGGLPTTSEITADDLHYFDQLDESPGLSNRYQRPSVKYYGGGGSGSGASA